MKSLKIARLAIGALALALLLVLGMQTTAQAGGGGVVVEVWSEDDGRDVVLIASGLTTTTVGVEHGDEVNYPEWVLEPDGRHKAVLEDTQSWPSFTLAWLDEDWSLHGDAANYWRIGTEGTGEQGFIIHLETQPEEPPVEDAVLVRVYSQDEGDDVVLMVTNLPTTTVGIEHGSEVDEVEWILEADGRHKAILEETQSWPSFTLPWVNEVWEIDETAQDYWRIGQEGTGEQGFVIRKETTHSPPEKPFIEVETENEGATLVLLGTNMPEDPVGIEYDGNVITPTWTLLPDGRSRAIIPDTSEWNSFTCYWLDEDWQINPSAEDYWRVGADGTAEEGFVMRKQNGNPPPPANKPVVEVYTENDGDRLILVARNISGTESLEYDGLVITPNWQLEPDGRYKAVIDGTTTWESFTLYFVDEDWIITIDAATYWRVGEDGTSEEGFVLSNRTDPLPEPTDVVTVQVDAANNGNTLILTVLNLPTTTVGIEHGSEIAYPAWELQPDGWYQATIHDVASWPSFTLYFVDEVWSIVSQGTIYWRIGEEGTTEEGFIIRKPRTLFLATVHR